MSVKKTKAELEVLHDRVSKVKEMQEAFPQCDLSHLEKWAQNERAKFANTIGKKENK